MPMEGQPMTAVTSKRTSSFSLTSLVQKGLWVSAFAVGGLACLWNMQPYIRLVRMGQAYALNMGMAVPQGARFALVSGILLWSLLQLGEVYYVILMHDRQAIRGLLAGLKNSDSLGIDPNDDAESIKLKEAYNRVSAASIRTARRWMWVAYGLDAMMCVTVYPPAGSFREFFFLILTGRWGQLNWANIAMIFAMMFIFEAMVRICLYLNKHQVLISKKKAAN